MSVGGGQRARRSVRPARPNAVHPTYSSGVIVLAGSVEAQEVRDGRLRVMLDLGGNQIKLVYPAALRRTVLAHLCTRVHVSGLPRRDLRTGQTYLLLVTIRPEPATPPVTGGAGVHRSLCAQPPFDGGRAAV